MNGFTSIEATAQRLQSLALLMQDSAEHGDLDISIYADVLELMSAMAAVIRRAVENGAA